MSYQESDFQTEFGKWVVRSEQIAHFGTANFELKCVKGKSFNPKNDFQPHQLPELWHSKHKHVYMKHSDQSAGKKPWDCSLWVGVPGYMVILFYVPRQPKRFHVVDVDDMYKIIATSPTPYIKEEQLDPYSQVFVL